MLRVTASIFGLMVASTALAQTTMPASADPQAFTVAIRQRDSHEQRNAAVAQVRQMLVGNPAAQVTALTVLVQVTDIRFDRTGLEPAVAALLHSPSPEVRRAALTALPSIRPGAHRIDQVAALATDPDPTVRAAVVPAIISIRRTVDVNAPLVEPALTLLGDKEESVVTATAQSLWSVPLGAEVEEKVIALSRFDDRRLPHSSSVPYTMNYYVLSTRPKLSRAVAQRLAEIARHPMLDQNWTGRAIWGMNRPPAESDAADVVTRALSEELDHSLTPYNRQWAVRGLATAGTAAAKQKLEEVANKDDAAELRQLAVQLLGK